MGVSVLLIAIEASVTSMAPFSGLRLLGFGLFALAG